MSRNTEAPTLSDLSESECTGLLFRAGQRSYAWGAYETSDVVGPAKVQEVNTEWGSGKWFLFFVEDCAFPPMFVVQHRSFESAYEEFVDWQADRLKISDEDLKDYTDGGGDLECDHTSYGVPVDTSSVQGFEITLVEAKFKGPEVVS